MRAHPTAAADLHAFQNLINEIYTNWAEHLGPMPEELRSTLFWQYGQGTNSSRFEKNTWLN